MIQFDEFLIAFVIGYLKKKKYRVYFNLYKQDLRDILFLL